MIISQCFNFTTPLKHRKPVKYKTQIKIVHKFERLIVLIPKQLCISYNRETVTGDFLVTE